MAAVNTWSSALWMNNEGHCNKLWLFLWIDNESFVSFVLWAIYIEVEKICMGSQWQGYDESYYN